MTKIAVVYYSWSGHTAQLAQLVHARVGGDLVALTVPAGTFSADLYETSDRAKAQVAAGKLPPLTGALPDLTRYDLVLVGGPVWSGAPATPIRAFLASAQGNSATFAPFYTHAGTAGAYKQKFGELAGDLHVAPGFGVVGANVSGSVPGVATWLASLTQD